MNAEYIAARKAKFIVEHAQEVIASLLTQSRTYTSQEQKDIKRQERLDFLIS